MTSTGRTDQHGGSARGKIDTRDQAHSGCYDLRAKGILSQAQAESRNNHRLDQGGRDDALLAVAEALQFSSVKIARGPAADSCAKSRSAFRIRAFLPVQVRGRGSGQWHRM